MITHTNYWLRINTYLHATNLEKEEEEEENTSMRKTELSQKAMGIFENDPFLIGVRKNLVASTINAAKICPNIREYIINQGTSKKIETVALQEFYANFLFEILHLSPDKNTLQSITRHLTSELISLVPLDWGTIVVDPQNQHYPKFKLRINNLDASNGVVHTFEPTKI